MNLQLLYLLVFLMLLLLLIGITELLHRVAKLPAEQSRKFLHVSGGIMCLLLPHFFNSHWWVLGLAFPSFCLLFFTYRKKLLASIHQTKRYSVGSIIFPIPVYLCFLSAELMHNDLFYFIPVSLLTISDTSAEMAGIKWGLLGKQFFDGQKTIIGSLAFALSSLIICFSWLYLYADCGFLHALALSVILSIVTSITELVTLRGWDNLSVPIVTVGLLLLLLQ